MKISYSPYKLYYRSQIPHREGALLRIEFPNKQIGFCDCHPWDKTGDKPLVEQLSLLAQGLTTPLTVRSLHFAKIDAAARAKKINLFKDLTIPKSHLLLPDLLNWREEDISSALKSGITHFKIKLGSDLSHEIPRLIDLFVFLKGSAKIRLDLNTKLNRKGFEQFLGEVFPFKEFIDFYEDPFPYDVDAWAKHQEKASTVFAADLRSEEAISHPKSAKVIVLKPAIQDEAPFLNLQPGRRFVITSYLDHPLGQLQAAYVAALCKKTDLCGLITHLVYQTNEFSERLPKGGPQLTPPGGTGFGYDDLLSKQSWKRLG